MRTTLAFMFLTLASLAMKVAALLNDYPGIFTSVAACVTIICGVRTLFRKDRRD